MSINNIHSDQRFWTDKVQLLAEGKNLRWTVTVDHTLDTVTLKIVHVLDVKEMNKMPDLVAHINVDRSKKSEDEIMNEIRKAIAERTLNR